MLYIFTRGAREFGEHGADCVIDQLAIIGGMGPRASAEVMQMIVRRSGGREGDGANDVTLFSLASLPPRNSAGFSEQLALQLRSLPIEHYRAVLLCCFSSHPEGEKQVANTNLLSLTDELFQNLSSDEVILCAEPLTASLSSTPYERHLPGVELRSVVQGHIDRYKTFDDSEVDRAKMVSLLSINGVRAVVLSCTELSVDERLRAHLERAGIQVRNPLSDLLDRYLDSGNRQDAITPVDVEAEIVE